MADDARFERTSGALKDGGLNWTTSWGVAGVPYRSADASAGSINVTDVPRSGCVLVLDDIFISVGVAMTVTLTEESASTVIFGPADMPANSIIQFTPRGRGKHTFTPNKRVQLQTSVAGNITVDLGYHSDPSLNG